MDDFRAKLQEVGLPPPGDPIPLSLFIYVLIHDTLTVPVSHFFCYQVPLNEYFPDYTGGPDADAAASYLRNRFMKLNRRPLALYPL
jgi:hypothetical protein